MSFLVTTIYGAVRCKYTVKWKIDRCDLVQWISFKSQNSRLLWGHVLTPKDLQSFIVDLEIVSITFYLRYLLIVAFVH